MTLKRMVTGVGLGLCLLLGVFVYHNKQIRQEVQEIDLSKDSLCESKNRAGFLRKILASYSRMRI